MLIAKIRAQYHEKICGEIIRFKHTARTGAEYPNFADGDSKSSREIAQELAAILKCPKSYAGMTEQTAGRLFEMITAEFLETAFKSIQHLRPGKWRFSTTRTAISEFDQYEHLAYLQERVNQDKSLGTALGRDYIVKPDIAVARYPVSDTDINERSRLVNSRPDIARLTPLRRSNRQVESLMLHASISCKWTIRSDRSQNTRTEALNLIRNRKGQLAHIAAVTAEPLPTRIASLALGTGDLDCVYHFALPELAQAIKTVNNQDQAEMLAMMVEGRRLRDISDLPFDLAT